MELAACACALFTNPLKILVDLKHGNGGPQDLDTLMLPLPTTLRDVSGKVRAMMVKQVPGIMPRNQKIYSPAQPRSENASKHRSNARR